MTVSFPFEPRPSDIFRMVYRPIAVVSFWSAKIHNWVQIPMLVDTGADYTLLPRYHAQNLGVDLEKECYPYLTEGVGGSEPVYLLRRCRAKLGQKEWFIPVGFLDRDNIPPLLGRQRCLENMRMTMDEHVTTFDL